MNSFTAFLDACVLYPAPTRDLLMELAVSDLYRAKWSDRVHEEWIAAALRERDDLTRVRLERTRDLMNAHVRDALVTDYEDLIETIDLPDPEDPACSGGRNPRPGRSDNHRQSERFSGRAACDMGHRGPAP